MNRAVTSKKYKSKELGLQASVKMRLDASFYKNRLGESLDYRPRNKLLHILQYHALLNSYKSTTGKNFDNLLNFGKKTHL